MRAQNPEIYHGSVYNVIPCLDDTVMLEDRGDISAKDGWKTANIPGLAEVRTAQTIAMSEYLKDCDLPMAYIEPVNATTIRQYKVNMLKGEFVVRQHLIGSYQERYPHVPKQRSKELVCELFAKQSLDLRDTAQPRMVDGNALRREFREAAGGDERAGWQQLEAQIEGKRIFMDPLVWNGGENWHVYDAHAMQTTPDKPLHKLKPMISMQEELACWNRGCLAFHRLADGLGRIDCAKIGLPGLKELLLADIKFEFGFTADGQLVMADMVNLDSLRLLKNGGYAKEDHLSKQKYRDEEANDERMFRTVLETYEYGRRAVEQLKAA